MRNKTESAIPGELTEALRNHPGKYTKCDAIYYCVQAGPRHWVGVFGDGANGHYEWFSFRDGELELSDQGWGDAERALLTVLVKALI